MNETEALSLAIEAAKAAQIAAEKAAAQEADWLTFILKLMELIPELLLMGIVTVMLWFNRDSLVGLLDNVTSFKAMGLEVQLAAIESLNKAVGSLDDGLRIQTTVDGKDKNIRVTEEDERRAIIRAEHAINVLKGRRVLWVDDLLLNNVHEVHTLELIGLKVIQVTNNRDALLILKDSRARIHVVISDISRPDGEPSGINLLESMAENSFKVPLIYYITKVDERKSLPAASNGVRAFGLTNRPDELVHLLLDILERRYADTLSSTSQPLTAQFHQ